MTSAFASFLSEPSGPPQDKFDILFENMRQYLLVGLPEQCGNFTGSDEAFKSIKVFN